MAFWFFLSTRFGRTVSELKTAMTYAEFVQHMAFHRVHPWGDDWAQAGTITWAVQGAPHWKYSNHKPDDFVPRIRRLKRQSVSEMRAILFDPEKMKIVNGGC